MQRDCDCDPSRQRREEYSFGPLAHECLEFAFSSTAKNTLNERSGKRKRGCGSVCQDLHRGCHFTDKRGASEAVRVHPRGWTDWLRVIGAEIEKLKGGCSPTLCSASLNTAKS